MNHQLLVGLTGGIGSGKSTVADFFAALGADVIDTDLIARELVEPGQPALAEIVTTFGTTILDADGYLDRKRLGEIVFRNSSLRKQLENILHPRILASTLQRTQLATRSYRILVIPLLIETGQDYPVNRVLVVDTPTELQTRRILARDGIRQDEVEQRLACQVSREQRLAVADDVISNDADLDSLKAQTVRLHRFYAQLAGNT